jgi:NAD(P)-dependent dehydrogenase (short-subunit alcohol dehydrogenase family)
MEKTYPFPVDPNEFSGKRVLVTGGTKGLGAAMVQRFHLSGAKVALTARSPSSSVPESALFVPADVSTAAGVQAVTDRIQNEWGGIDILVDNVGSSDHIPGGFESLDDDYWMNSVNQNLMSAVRLDRAFIPGMIERKFGVVIHIGTLWHRLVQSDCSLAYSATKGALSSYSKGLANGVGQHGVRVNMVSPGFIETESATAFIEYISESQKIDTQAARQALMDRSGGIPVGRPGKPAEIAELVAFLASDRGAFAHGVDYLLDGGCLRTV